MMGLSIFPTINAMLNALAFAYLFLGWRAIKAGRRKAHIRNMCMALAASVLFLISYVGYHAFVHGYTRYQGQGVLRPVYFTILASHTVLAMVIVPFVVAAVWRAMKNDFEGHKRITRRLLPVWMYVSVTGVAVYFMLYVISSR
jgi:uncharacterized membrane protein YozB (DUF420 family)